jgi:hypothetical protein
VQKLAKQMAMAGGGNPAAAPPVAARPPRPAAGADTTTLVREIGNLARLGRHEEAFTRALSASNLSLVSALCSSMDPAVVFGMRPPLLSAPVILSLIQQLGYDLSRDADTKLSWLPEAAMALDVRDPNVAQMAQSVLGGIVVKLEGVLKANAPPPLEHKAKIAIMMAKGKLSELGSR